MAVATKLQCRVLALVVALCIALPSSAQAYYTMQQTCGLYSEGYIADPADCQGWGYCKGGQLVTTGKCAPGLLFERNTGQCNYASEVNCVTSKATMCNGLNGVLKSDPEDCNTYCYCNNGVTECARCPAAQFYNPNSESCVWASTYQDCVVNSPCRLVPNNKFIADPAKCGNFMRCVDGAGTSGKCEGTLVFNPANGLCDSYSSLNCNGVPSVPTSSVGPVIDTSSICKANYKGTGEQYFSDGATCGGYVVCSSSTDRGSWQKCAFATHFDPSLKKCVTPFEYSCPYDRCDNLNLNFVAVANSRCLDYVDCKNQRSTTSSFSCKANNRNFPYFDEQAGGCTAMLPKQKICG